MKALCSPAYAIAPSHIQTYPYEHFAEYISVTESLSVLPATNLVYQPVK